MKYILEIVKSTIDDWNPYSLISDNSLDNEFDREIKSVSKKISKDSSVSEIASVISRVFSSSFEPSQFQKKDCMEVAARIKDRIGQNHKK